MNISELARKLKVTTQELKEKLPELGFDIGLRAIQIPDEQAARVVQAWQEYKNQEEKKKKFGEIQERLAKKEVISDKILILPSIITVHDLAKKLNFSVAKVIQQLMNNGVLATINDNLDFEIAAILLEQFGYKAQKENVEEKEKKEETILKEKLQNLLAQDKKDGSTLRAPIVVVMGHIDHGKTSLLDYIRQTQIAAKEAGAITQHIGAYEVIKKNRKITFIDTPGHEAFKVMRGRGGQVADLAILVVAADDGVQEQTVESLKIIQKESLPFIVAINKIDKPDANPEKIKKQLAELNVTPEDWGGKTICHPVSAKTGQGVDELLDLILILADLEKEKLTVDQKRPAVGTIIEAHLDKGKGPAATAIIHTGILRVGDSVVVGESFGKIRALNDWRNKEVREALPGMPVEIIGVKNMPKVGDILEVKDEKEFNDLKKKTKTKKYFKISEKITKEEEEKEKNTLKLILKADVLGSLEALIEAIQKLETPEVKIKIIKKGLSMINEIDVVEAEKSAAIIIGFNAEQNNEAKKSALEKGVKIFVSKIIYDLLDKIKEEVKITRGEKIKEVFVGRLKILATFRRLSDFSIIGGRVIEGKITNRSKTRVWREKNIVGEGFISGMQVNKKEVDEARENEECGVKYRGSEEIKVGDILEVYKEEKS